MSWPDNTQVKRKPSNKAALKLLEDGYVIVNKYDVPSDVVPYGTPIVPAPYTVDPGESGDVLTRIDSYNFAGHRNWVKAGTPPLPAIPDDAPNDGRLYGRQRNTWVAAENAGDIVYIQDWSINAGDTPGAQYIFTLPVATLPSLPFHYMVSFFLTNHSKSAYPFVNSTYAVEVEEPLGSGTFIPTASIGFNSNTLNVPESVLFAYPSAPGANRVYHFDPLTAGIRFRIVCKDATDPSIAGVVSLGFNGKVVQFS